MGSLLIQYLLIIANIFANELFTTISIYLLVLAPG